jgi:hypothetical protein
VKVEYSDTVEIQIVITQEIISRESFTLQVPLTARQGCLYTRTSPALTDSYQGQQPMPSVVDRIELIRFVISPILPLKPKN